MEAAEIAAAQDDGSAEEENATGTEAEADEAEVADLDIEMEEEDALMDTYEDCFKPADTTHYLTMEEMHEMKTVDKRVKVPPLSKWKELASTQKIHITVAKARRRLWKQAKDEVEVFRKNVKDLRLGTSAPNQVEGDDLQRVYHYLFGATSKLADIFLRNIDGLSKQDYLSFMLTYFMSCKYGHAVATLHNAPDEEFNSGALMPTAQYNGIWRKIAKLRATNREEAFWQELETTMNFLCRKLFMASKEDFPLFHYRIGLDDDKPHYAWTKHSDATAIKKVHHAKDNRRGFTVHTAAYSATDVPVGVHCTMRLASRGDHLGKYSTSGEYHTHMGFVAVKSECESQFFQNPKPVCVVYAHRPSLLIFLFQMTLPAAIPAQLFHIMYISLS
jgi:hypothetical protein